MSDSLENRPSATTRMYELDALRAFCMLFGMFPHSSHLTDSKINLFLAEASDFFRMGAFFAVSGILGAMQLNRIGCTTFYNRRTISLIVPFIATLVLINPLTIACVIQYHSGDFTVSRFFEALELGFSGAKAAGYGPIVWHMQLWFLPSLLIYSLCLPLMVKALLRVNLPSLTNAILSRTPEPLRVALIGLGLALAVVFCRAVASVVGQLLSGSQLQWLIVATIRYAPFFYIGALVYYADELSKAIRLVSAPSLLVSALLYWIINENFSARHDFGFAIVLAKALFSSMIVIFLIAVFSKFCGQKTLLSSLTDGIYTVYLLHYLFIYIFGLMIMPYVSYSFTGLVVVIVLTTLFTLMIHFIVVLKYPLLRFLLNGKALRKEPSPRESLP